MNGFVETRTVTASTPFLMENAMPATSGDAPARWRVRRRLLFSLIRNYATCNALTHSPPEIRDPPQAKEAKGEADRPRPIWRAALSVHANGGA
jgi:hypothetical protein